MKIIKWLLFVMGLILLIDGAIMVLISNFTTGNILVLLLGAVLFIWGWKFEQIREKTKSGTGRILRILVIIGLAVTAVLCTFFAVYGNTDTVTYDEDVLIVLGCAVNGDVPTQPLMARLDKAIEYSKKNPDVHIVVTGGQGPQEDITEAECMSRYLTERGISSDRIIKEEQATSTSENYKYSKEILDERFGEYSAAVITNDFHIFRAKQLAKIGGLEVTTMHAHTPVSSSPVMYLREILAVGKMILFKE